MKNTTKLQIGLSILTLVVAYMWFNPRVVKVESKPELPVLPRPTAVRRDPEYRGPPIKKYKPGHMQQMGILTGSGEVTMPLYYMVKKSQGDGTGIIITRLHPVNKFTQFQSVTTPVIVWKI